MSDNKLNIKIISDTRKTDAWVKGTGNNNITFSAKVFDKGSVHGIDKGRVSKLEIYQNNRWIINYDRGWDIKPATPEHKIIYEAIMKRLNVLGLTQSIKNTQRTLQEKLEAAKEKVAIKEFDVTITETLQMTVTVEAKNLTEAKKIVSDNWNKGEYTIDAEHFKSVTFEPIPIEKEQKLTRKDEER